MKKLLLLAAVLMTGLSVSAQVSFSVKNIAASEFNHTKNLTNVRAERRTAPRKDVATASWSESFENCDEDDMFALPEGWTAKRTPEFMHDGDPHTWTVMRQYNLFYPQPMDGTHYACCFYNDDEYQDEWLYTPELTPQEGEYLTYFVTLQPFFLFDGSKYDKESGTLSEYISTADMRLHISVDGGEWQQVNSLFEIYSQENIKDLYELAFYGYVSNRKMFVDMAQYVGHSVRFGFQYVGQGGDSMYLDDLRLTQLSMTVSYDAPEGAMYLGMTPDFQQPAGYLFLPDNTDLTWKNTSSYEAMEFNWTYAPTDDTCAMGQSSDRDLVTNYNGYVPESEQTTGDENTYIVPTLYAKGQGGLTGQYTHPAERMIIGGKADVTIDGNRYHTGATYCNPQFGSTVMMASDGITPFFGVGGNNKALWTQLFGTESRIIGAGVHVTEPAKAWTMRGLHIQGVGNIEKAYRLKVAVRRFNVYGSVDDEPIATAVIDVDNIVEQPVEGSDHKQYTLPFLFADPITIDRDVIITLEGLPKAASWFAPLQTEQLEPVEDNSHAVFMYEYFDGQENQNGMNYVSNLGVGDDEGNIVPLAVNYFFNFDIAYGDCDDWQHIDIEPAGPEMPDMKVADNTIQIIDAETEVSFFGEEIPYKPLLCGFYDEKTDDTTTLYFCIGQLYEIEEAPFYSDRVNDTYYIRITMPKSYIDGEPHAIGDDVVADFYDLLSHSWIFHASEGTVIVSEPEQHIYTLDMKALDRSSYLALGARYVRPESWRFRDFNEVRPNPSQFELKKSGRVTLHRDILSCVVDQSNPELPLMYFADQENLQTVGDVENLPADEYVCIQCPTSMMDGLLKGFSGWADDDLTVIFKGVRYNHSGCKNDETCYGGNVGVTLYDTENNRLNISSTIYTLISENMSNLSLHYEGSFVVDNTAGIYDVEASTTITGSAIYNLAGQKLSQPSKGINIINGKKILVK